MAYLFQGTRELGQDQEFLSVEGSYDLTPSGTGVYNVTNGYTIFNYSGTYTAVLPSGIETTTSSLYFKNSINQPNTVTITGTAGAGQTFDTKPAIFLAGTGAHVRLVNYSGSDWVTI